MISVCGKTQTYEIIEDVARMRSEIGILFLKILTKRSGKILKSHRAGNFIRCLLQDRMFLSAASTRWREMQ